MPSLFGGKEKARKRDANVLGKQQIDSNSGPPRNKAVIRQTRPHQLQDAGTSANSFNASQMHLPPQPSAAIQGQSHNPQQASASAPRSLSYTNLTQSHENDRQRRVTGYVNQGAALVDRISDRMNTVLTAMDEEQYSRGQDDFDLPPECMATHQETTQNVESSSKKDKQSPRYFAKVWLYSNSRLPPHLPPLKLYIPTYPILCLAAQHSLRVYSPSSTTTATSTSSSTTVAIPSSLRTGSKAMTLTTTTLDTTSTIVLAIRGSQTFMDWAVNFRPAPTSPAGFLADPGNLCHAGFLAVARSMLAPVATHLRSLLDARPSRRNPSLILTGHSAGGAVAALLYAHALAPNDPVHPLASDFRDIANAFRRIHCVTFGAPPVSLLPLQRPDNPHADTRLRKSIFFAFVNEGDPVARADVAFLKSLVALYASPPPSPQTAAASWPVPPCTLSCAGRVVLLRAERGETRGDAKGTGNVLGRLGWGGKSGSGSGKVGGEKAEERVTASVVSDEQLRGVVFGDVAMHMMTLYASRIERLAVGAVTVGGAGA